MSQGPGDHRLWPPCPRDTLPALPSRPARGQLPSSTAMPQAPSLGPHPPIPSSHPRPHKPRPQTCLPKPIPFSRSRSHHRGGGPRARSYPPLLPWPHSAPPGPESPPRGRVTCLHGRSHPSLNQPGLHNHRDHPGPWPPPSGSAPHRSACSPQNTRGSFPECPPGFPSVLLLHRDPPPRGFSHTPAQSTPTPHLPGRLHGLPP